ncbi:MAG: DUF1826 domain-containing protein [Nitrosomonas sp.]|uniref:DUF1826 domain-containing protein n=1 Tax=Nitrosomonas sp. TaxID=42353 RepID=UPI00271B85FA|nr:DUF1826 domain-containing protein [Nitrosomonas sp.]MDO9469970.1 DUF1826 domain-containing protein [Nitrosomonas sp.]MDP1550350.1 DUF1826 domain-containing protein [Nitrosomonas sp.]MDP1787077.1 DUF1826 domain-containing protein [Nitrosomonas sp.]MDP2223065.1 DUF1826 domain-containing protein [Nitrosomonas sp.]
MQTYPAIDHLLNQVTSAQSTYVTGCAPEVLAQIYDMQINMCILQRSIAPDVRMYAAFLQKEYVDFQLIRRVNIPSVVDVLMGSLPAHSMRVSFIEDVAMAVDMFSCLFDLDHAGLRLLVLNKTMCPRFHADKVPCRLVTTYAGKGTEWLDREGIDRSALGTSEEPIVEHDLIQHLSEGDIALLKGDGWEGNEGSGVIHRSPSLNDNETRLLLTLDFV